jgi:hypothetical protein
MTVVVLIMMMMIMMMMTIMIIIIIIHYSRPGHVAVGKENRRRFERGLSSTQNIY